MRDRDRRSDIRTISTGQARKLAHNVLTAYGVPDDITATVADVLLEADKRGTSSHGLARLPSYVKRLKAGLITGSARSTVRLDAGALVLLDGENGLGPSVAMEATKLVKAKVQEHGLACVVARRANHFGIAGYYAIWLANKGFIGVVMTNAAPAMAAYNGRRAILGTNPLAAAVPSRAEPLVLDMASTVVARGKIRNALAAGDQIPEGWAMDTNGNPATDPAAALEGSLMPVGGPKGYGLAALVDLLTGVWSGGAFLDSVGAVADLSRPCNTSFSIFAIDPSRLLEHDVFMNRVHRFGQTLKDSGGGREVFLPGEIEARTSSEGQTAGVGISARTLAELEELLRRAPPRQR